MTTNLSKLNNYELEQETRYNKTLKVAAVAATGVAIALYPQLAPDANFMAQFAGQTLLAGAALGAVWASSTVILQKAITTGLNLFKGKDDATIELEKRNAQVEANIRENSVGKSEKEIKASIKEFNKEQRIKDVQETYKDHTYDDIKDKSRISMITKGAAIAGGAVGLASAVMLPLSNYQPIFEKLVYMTINPVIGAGIGAIMVGLAADFVINKMDKNAVELEIDKKWDEKLESEGFNINNKISSVRNKNSNDSNQIDSNLNNLKNKINANRSQLNSDNDNIITNGGMKIRV